MKERDWRENYILKVLTVVKFMILFSVNVELVLLNEAIKLISTFLTQ